MRQSPNSIEALAATAVLTFQVQNTFIPLESYLAPQVVVLNQEVLQVSAFPSQSMVLGASLLFTALVLVRRWHVILPAALRVWPILIFAALSLASIAVSPDPGLALRRVIRFHLALVLGLYFVVSYDLKGIMTIAMRCYGIAAIASIGMSVLLPQYGLSLLTGYEGAWRGAYQHKNHLGAMAAVGAVLCGYAITSRTIRLIYAVPLLLAMLLILVMSRSATGAIVALMALGVLVLLNIRHASDRIVIGLVAASAVIVVQVFIDTDDLFQLVGRSADFTGRAAGWDAVAAMAARQPWFGFGYGFWYTEAPEILIIRGVVNYAIPHAHNDWLDCWLQMGYVGLASLTLVYVSVLLALWHGVKTGHGRALILPVVLVLFTFVRGFTETSALDPGVHTRFWFWLACIWMHYPLLVASTVRDVRPRDALAIGRRLQAGA